MSQEELKELWTLARGSKTGRCVFRSHPVGLELAWFIDGSLVKSRAFRTEDEALAEAAAWKERLETKGWAVANVKTIGGPSRRL